MVGLIIGIVIGVLFLLSLGGLAFIHHNVFYSPVKGQNNDYNLTKDTLEIAPESEIRAMIDELKSHPFEDAYIKSFDRKRLHAKIYDQKSDTTVIMCHGYRGTCSRDFSGGGVDMLNYGYNVILIDERGHGLSGGHNITFGKREQYDVVSWYKYAKERFGKNTKIVLVGISMGGASVLFAADKIDEEIKIIADCPYSTIEEEIKFIIKDKLHMPPKILYPLANLSSIIFAHSSLNKMDASKNVKNSKAKILLIHGKADTLVPQKFSERIYEENKDKVTYVTFDGADHGLSYIVDKKKYNDSIKEFLAK